MSEPAVFSGDCGDDGRIVFDIPSAVTAYCRKHYAGQRVDVEIRPRKAKRSIQQNRAMWAGWKGWADFLGYGVDELRLEMLALVFGTHQVTSPITGEHRQALNMPNSSKLTTAQFCELMERAVIEAAGTGYVLLLPDEWKAAREKARKRAA